MTMKAPSLHLTIEYTYRDMFAAYMSCRRAKRNTRSQIAFEIRFERNLAKLLEEVNSGAYRIGPSRVFVVTHPKPREVWAAQFRDRIIHHLIYNSIGPWFEARFIEDTYSCIPGRGTLAASRRFETFCRRATGNWAQEAYALKIDIRSFFVSINRAILWETFRDSIGEGSLTARLVRQNVFHDPTVGVFVAPQTRLDLVPSHKSLWTASRRGCGLAIGNHTSQFASNVYLDGLDKYIKHTLKARWYVRYVDDAVLVSHDREELADWCAAIDDWLRSHRALSLHPNKIHIGPLSQGVEFVGRLVLPYRTYTRKMTAHAAKQAARRLRKHPADDKAMCSVNSYLGLLRQADTFNLRAALCKQVCFPLITGTDKNCNKVSKLWK
jgi:RNA-directed DNA polymerase